MTPLQRAQDLQRKAACETTVYIRLDLLEALIAEIVELQQLVPSTHPLRAVKTRAEERAP